MRHDEANLILERFGLLIGMDSSAAALEGGDWAEFRRISAYHGGLMHASTILLEFIEHDGNCCLYAMGEK